MASFPLPVLVLAALTVLAVPVAAQQKMNMPAMNSPERTMPGMDMHERSRRRPTTPASAT